MKTLIALIGTFGVTLAAIKLLLPVPLPLPIPLPVAAAGAPSIEPTFQPGERPANRSDATWRSPEDPMPSPYVGPYGAETHETPADRALKSKCEELDSANAKLDAAKATIDEQQSKINSLSDGLDKAERHEMEIHDEEFVRLKQQVSDLKAKAATPPEPSYPWIFDDPWKADAQAKATGRAVLVLFSVPTCRPCKIIENTCLTDTKVLAYLVEHYTLAHVDADANQQAAKAFGLPPGTIMPRAFIYDPTVRQMEQYVPSADPETFLQQIQSMLPRSSAQQHR